MRRTAIAAVALAGLAACSAPQVFEAENRVNVVPAPGGFDVLGDGGFGARGMWCAAADYARRVLGAPGQADLYIAAARTPGLGQRAPVRFTLDPAGLTPSSVFIVGTSLSRAGATLTVDHAHAFCADAKVINR